MPETLDQIFAAFASRDREPLTQMHGEGGFVYVTDGHTGFEIPSDILENEYGPVKEYPNLRSRIDHSNEGTFYSLEQIDDALSAWEVVDEIKSVSCMDCGGSGGDYCDYCDRGDRCRECDGEVDVERRTGRRTLKSTRWIDAVVLEGHHYDPQKLFAIRGVVEALGETGLLVTRRGGGKNSLAFQIGRVRGVLMRMLAPDGPPEGKIAEIPARVAA